MIEQDKKLQNCLLILRISVFIVMFMWTIDKFIDPEHAARVYEKFYFISGLESLMMYLIGSVEMVILLLFLLGIKKTFSYGAVLLFHAVSTLSSFEKYLSPFEPFHLLFFAAWPMLAACYVLFVFRKEDVKCTFNL